MTPIDRPHPLEGDELTVAALFEDLAAARRQRLRGWASQLEDEVALSRGSFVPSQAAAAVDQIAATMIHPGLDELAMFDLADEMVRLAARLEQIAAESGVEPVA